MLCESRRIEDCTSRDLNETDYLHFPLANFIVHRGRLGRCRGCNSYFRRTDSRQEFCPAPDGHKHNDKREGVQVQATSLCASNYRMRKWREKERAERGSGHGGGADWRVVGAVNGQTRVRC